MLRYDIYEHREADCQNENGMEKESESKKTSLSTHCTLIQSSHFFEGILVYIGIAIANSTFAFRRRATCALLLA